MADWTEKGNEHPVVNMRIEPDEKIAICRCFESKNMPFCDGSHKNVPGKGPVIIEVKKEE